MKHTVNVEQEAPSISLSAQEIYGSIFKEYPDIVGIADLQKMLSVGRNTAYNLLKEGKIRSIRIGKVHKIPKVSVIKFLQSEE